MKTEFVEVTIRDIAQAMITDTTPKAVGLFEFKYNKEDRWATTPIGFTASCAIAGAAVELGLDAYDLQNKLATVDRDGVPAPKDHKSVRDMAATIYTHNDETTKKKRTIGKMILDKADELTLNTKIKVAKIGTYELAALPFVGRRLARHDS